MKKSKLKMAVKVAMNEFYKNGLTNTGYVVHKKILSAIEKAYKSR